MEAGFIVLTFMGCLLVFAMISIIVTTSIEMNIDKDKPDLSCDDNTDCSFWEECYKGSCRGSCKDFKCGDNELCVSYFHRASCECKPGYVRTVKSVCRNNVIKLIPMTNSTAVNKIKKTSVTTKPKL